MLHTLQAFIYQNARAMHPKALAGRRIFEQDWPVLKMMDHPEERMGIDT